MYRFLRITSGRYQKGMKLYHVPLKKEIQINNVLTFMADERKNLDEAWPGDIIGIYNYGTIQIDNTFTQGERLQFIGIPNFSPELFRLVCLKEPFKKIITEGFDSMIRRRCYSAISAIQ